MRMFACGNIANKPGKVAAQSLPIPPLTPIDWVGVRLVTTKGLHKCMHFKVSNTAALCAHACDLHCKLVAPALLHQQPQPVVIFTYPQPRLARGPSNHDGAIILEIGYSHNLRKEISNNKKSLQPRKRKQNPVYS
jgi:hypothetical protein